MDNHREIWERCMGNLVEGMSTAHIICSQVISRIHLSISQSMMIQYILLCYFLNMTWHLISLQGTTSVASLTRSSLMFRSCGRNQDFYCIELHIISRLGWASTGTGIERETMIAAGAFYNYMMVVMFWSSSGRRIAARILGIMKNIGALQENEYYRIY